MADVAFGLISRTPSTKVSLRNFILNDQYRRHRSLSTKGEVKEDEKSTEVSLRPLSSSCVKVSGGEVKCVAVCRRREPSLEENCSAKILKSSILLVCADSSH